MLPKLRPASLVNALLAVAFGLCALWQLSEQDIYWQIRAGDDLITTLSFPHEDTWSFSVRGERWMNVQWLSTLLFRGLYAIGAENALIAARGICTSLLMGLIGSTIIASMQRDADNRDVPEWLRATTLAALLPLTFLALSARLQIRSDLLVTLVFAALIRLWFSEHALQTKRRGTLACVILAANLHAGTAPFALLLAGGFLFTSSALWREKALWSCAAVAAFFVTPYHFTVLPLLWAHLNYSAYNMLPNPDHVPVNMAFLRASDGFWVGVGWIPLCVGAAITWFSALRQRTALPTPYRHLFVIACTWLVLFALSINRARSIPYHVIYMVPCIAASLPTWRMPRLALAPIAAAACAAVVLYILAMRPLWGFGINEALFPVGSVKFLAREKPQPNLLHTFAYGAYTVWNLREYPVYVDTRETMYWQLQPEILAAYHSPDITQALVRKYDINAMLMPIPKTRYVPGLGFEDVLKNYLPQDEWALVYFDRLSVVVVRRIPAHDELIANHAYRVLHPNLPANLYPITGPRSPEQDDLFAREVGRCLSDEPTNAYCLIAQAVWWRVQGDTEHVQDAVRALETARATTGVASAQFATLMVELQQAYSRANMPAEAAAVAEAMGPGALMQAP